MPHGELQWSTPNVQAQDLADCYVKALRGASGVLGVWAEVLGNRLVIYTLVRRDLSFEDEDRVYAAEAVLLRAADDAEVDVRVLREGNWLPATLAEARLLYSPTG